MGAFKAYDIRGHYPEEVNEELAYQVGKATATFLQAKDIVVGMDCRSSSKPLFDALVKGILETGTNVINIGLVSTPQLYFSLYTSDIDGGIMITASHNNKEFNGFKICEKHAKPLFKDYGFNEIKQIIKEEKYNTSEQKGELIEENIFTLYKQFFKSLLDEHSFQLSKKYKVIFDVANGMGSRELEVIRFLYEDRLDIEVLFEEMNGTFPNHQANPIIEENMHALSEKLTTGKYNFGVGFDGDADRIAFFLPDGTMIPPDLITGIIGSYIATKNDRVGFEVRTSQAVPELLQSKKITPLLYPSGRAYMISKMRIDDAIFAGEKSGHYFYRELSYTDSSLYTFMNLIHILNSKNISLAELVEPLLEKHFQSGEINYVVKNSKSTLKAVEDFFFHKANKILKIDGISVYTEFYFFNIRKSNTEDNILRLNIEANSPQLVEEIKDLVEAIIK